MGKVHRYTRPCADILNDKSRAKKEVLTDLAEDVRHPENDHQDLRRDQSAERRRNNHAGHTQEQRYAASQQTWKERMDKEE